MTAPEDKEAARSRDGQDGPVPAALVAARWRSHYPVGYARRVRRLLDSAGSVLWDDDSEEGMRAAAFVREHLVPFFEGGAD